MGAADGYRASLVRESSALGEVDRRDRRRSGRRARRMPVLFGLKVRSNSFGLLSAGLSALFVRCYAKA